MKKLSVSIRIPALEGEYNFLIPSNMRVKEARALILSILNGEYGISRNLNDLILFDTNDLRALGLDYSFEELNISDGDKLLLI